MLTLPFSIRLFVNPRVVALLFLSLLLSLLSACTRNNTYDDLVVASMDTIKTQYADNLRSKHQGKAIKPTVGIAFGGGGVRGFIHIGVIKALEEAGIRPARIAGSSAGSFIAAAYASGMSYREIMDAAGNMKVWDLADLVISHRGGIQGQKIAHWVNTAIQDQDKGSRIERMPIPLGITVTDVLKQQSLLITEGNIGHAVQASSSIPGAFVPVQARGVTYVDGGVLALVPVKFARAMGADIVIGVDVYCGNFFKRLERGKDKEAITALIYHVTRLQTCMLSKPELHSADFVISPDFEPSNIGSFAEREASVQAGYDATQKIIPDILKRIERQQRP